MSGGEGEARGTRPPSPREVTAEHGGSCLAGALMAGAELHAAFQADGSLDLLEESGLVPEPQVGGAR